MQTSGTEGAQELCGQKLYDCHEELGYAVRHRYSLISGLNSFVCKEDLTQLEKCMADAGWLPKENYIWEDDAKVCVSSMCLKRACALHPR